MSGSNPGSTPNWVDGYVPPASEWNAWWGFKLDAVSPLLAGAPSVSLAGSSMTGPLILSGDPTANLGACTKQYADSKLPLAGGSISGALGVAGDISTNSDLIVDGVLHIGTAGNFQWFFGTVPNTGDHVQTHTSGWYDQWTVTNGHRYWYGSNINLMDLDGGGNLTVRGNFVTTGGSLDATGVNLQGGWMFANGGGSGNDYQYHGTGGTNTYEMWERDNGSRTWVSSGLDIMSLDNVGNLFCNGAVHGSNITTLEALVEDLQARIAVLERMAPT